LTKPALAVCIDYGQRPAKAESAAALAVGRSLDLEVLNVELNLTALGGGLLQDEEPLAGAPSPEWWPFRNQFLITAASVVALRLGLNRVLVGAVLGDGDRHVDGSEAFFRAISQTTSIQEGGITVEAPASQTSTVDLVRRSELDTDVIGWTVSCHRSNLPCMNCPGCFKREAVLSELGVFQEKFPETT